jgi:lactoylglutathione lyase
MHPNVKLSLLVLRCADLERSREFYSALGLTLVAEQHDQGPLHYSITLGTTVLELYPFTDERTSGVRIGLGSEDPEKTVAAVRLLCGVVVQTMNGEAVVRDPDGHVIHIVPSTFS